MIEPFYQDEFITLYQGDVRTVLPQIETEIQCCVTSPPYFGLRDYGTADWEGGDAECEHTISAPDADNKAVFAARDTRGERNACLRCGAVRIDSQIGLEPTPAEFIATMVEVFEGVRSVLKKDGTLFLNLGDSYNGTSAKGFKLKDLLMMPHRSAMALQDAGWYVRADMPWVKRNPMPESVKDRPAKALEYVFLLTKNAKYFCDMDAVRQGGWDTENGVAHGTIHKNGRRDRSLPNNRNGEHGNLDATPSGSRNFRNSDLWYSSISAPYGVVGFGDELVGLDVNPSGFKEAHFATFPKKLVEPLIKMGSREGDTILEPFAGAGTTLIVAKRLGRKSIGIELNPEYCQMIVDRIKKETAMPLFD